jgi:hypothetical protein
MRGAGVVGVRGSGDEGRARNFVSPPAALEGMEEGVRG